MQPYLVCPRSLTSTEGGHCHVRAIPDPAMIAGRQSSEREGLHSHHCPYLDEPVVCENPIQAITRDFVFLSPLCPTLGAPG